MLVKIITRHKFLPLTSFAFSKFRQAIITLAPLLARSRAVILPIPEKNNKQIKTHYEIDIA